MSIEKLARSLILEEMFRFVLSLISVSSSRTVFMMDLTDEEVDGGFDFVLGAPPEAMKQLKWMTKALKNEIFIFKFLGKIYC